MAWLANNLWLLAAVLVSFTLTGLALLYAQRVGMIDTPSARRSHNRPTARGGGIAITISMLLFLLLPVPVTDNTTVLLLFVSALSVITITGWVDDHRPLAARLRFAIQFLVAATVVAYYIVLVPETRFDTASVATILIATGLLLAICWNINLVNFMDGSNGLAAFTGLFCSLLLAWLFHQAGDRSGILIAATSAAAIAGFLPWNWPLGRIFMGDAGSYAIGFTLAFLSVHAFSTELVSLWQLILVQSVFVVDSTATLVYRVIRGEQWYTAHREHAYQRMLAMGMSHTRVLLIYALVNVFLILPVLVFIRSNENLERPIVILTLLILLGCWWLVQGRWHSTDNNNAE